MKRHYIAFGVGSLWIILGLCKIFTGNITAGEDLGTGAAFAYIGVLTKDFDEGGAP